MPAVAERPGPARPAAPFALWTDPDQPGAAWLYHDYRGEIRLQESGDLAATGARLAAASAAGEWLLLSLDYELGYVLEPAAAPAGWRPQRLLLRALRFAGRQRLDDPAAWLAGASSGPAGVGGLQPLLDEADYRAAVARIRDYIAAGDCYQVNYTFPCTFRSFGDPLALYAALCRQQPVRYGGFIAWPEGGALLSLSPELFLARRGERVWTRPMKGTAPASSDPAALAACPKNRAENLMIVDLLRNDLGRLARPGSVVVESLFEVERYPSLLQMVSQVAARLPGCDFPAILRALFPCGSITGAPKIRAMQIIGELEKAPRGGYTGALGVLEPSGDFCLNVAIRTLDLAADGQGRLGLGSGIVADSDPGDEWQECQLKAAFLTRLDPGLRLIETLRLDVGASGPRFPLLAGHLARLQTSAAWFGFPCEPTALSAELHARAARCAPGRWRVRLTLGKQGDTDITLAPLQPEASGPRLLRLARQRIDADDPLRRHKTTARTLYDRDLAQLASTPQVFDLLYLNQHGEVAEGARSNLFAYLDGHWLTPPLSSGALPGVLRQHALARGLAREARLTLADLHRARHLCCGNALRGFVPVDWEG